MRILTSALTTLILSWAAIAQSAELSSGLKALQGKWTGSRTNRSGDLYTFTLEFKGDKMTFEAKDPGGDPRLVAKGTAKSEKSGPFEVLTLADIRAGRSADDLQERNETRTSVYVLREDKLYLASNFDKKRENETPRVDEYSRVAGSAKASEDTSANFAGNWNLDLSLGDQNIDYKLRVEKSGADYQTIFISPRSGEHKAKSTTVKGDEVEFVIDREIQGNNVTFVYKGKLAQNKISGTLSVKNSEGEFSGTWTASR
jgi:hypothetical protein